MTTDEIKLWLKQQKHSRYWLAEKCFVTKGQVDNWLCGNRKIPDAKLLIIKSLVEKDIMSAFVPSISQNMFHGIVSVAPKFTAEEWELIEKAASIHNVDTETYIREAAMQIARQNQEHDTGNLKSKNDEAE